MNPSKLYIDLLARAIRNEFYRNEIPKPRDEDLAAVRIHLERMRIKFGPIIDSLNLDARTVFFQWQANSPVAHTLCDKAQVRNVRECVEYVVVNDVPGDLIEAGVFRGGQAIFMRGILKAYGITDRKVFVADSFEGLPNPDPRKDLDDAIAFELLNPIGRFAVSLQQVKENFAAYDLLDDQVVFLEGWFKDTLPAAPLSRLALIRLDGDFYDSTRDALYALYPKLSRNGFVIIDDYGLPIGCRRAVDEFRKLHGINDPLLQVNNQTYYWQKKSD